jgi:DNA-binding response OmpR family regulator
MVSARGDAVDRVRGFARGCDDYIVKPFVYDELVARMRAVLRRSNGPRHPRLSVRDLCRGDLEGGRREGVLSSRRARLTRSSSLTSPSPTLA